MSEFKDLTERGLDEIAMYDCKNIDVLFKKHNVQIDFHSE